MAIDTAAKRRNVAAMMPLFAPGVTPDAAGELVWRTQIAWGYSGIVVVTGIDLFLTCARVTVKPLLDATVSAYSTLQGAFKIEKC